MANLKLLQHQGTDVHQACVLPPLGIGPGLHTHQARAPPLTSSLYTQLTYFLSSFLLLFLSMRHVDQASLKLTRDGPPFTFLEIGSKDVSPYLVQAKCFTRTVRREDWHGALTESDSRHSSASRCQREAVISSWMLGFGGERISARWYICLSPRCYSLFSCLFQRRVVLLTQEMDAGLQAWKLRQQKLQEERKQEHDLKPKGILLRSPLPNQ